MGDDDFTPIACRACGGRGCGHCTRGAMSPEQYGAWMRSKSGPRNKMHRVVTIEKLLVAWDKAPGLRLGELLAESLARQHIALETLERMDDRRLVDLVQEYVMSVVR